MITISVQANHLPANMTRIHIQYHDKFVLHRENVELLVIITSTNNREVLACACIAIQNLQQQRKNNILS